MFLPISLSSFCSCSPIYRIMLRFRILAAAAAIGQGRRRLVHLVDERGILTFVVAPLLGLLLGIFPCRLPPSLPLAPIGLSLSETPASGLAFEACGGRRRGRFLSNGVKGKRGEGDAGRRGEESQADAEDARRDAACSSPSEASVALVKRLLLLRRFLAVDECEVF